MKTKLWYFYWPDGTFEFYRASTFAIAARKFYKKHFDPDFDIVRTGSVNGQNVEKCRCCGNKVFEALQTKSKYAGICDRCAE